MLTQADELAALCFTDAGIRCLYMLLFWKWRLYSTILLKPWLMLVVKMIRLKLQIDVKLKQAASYPTNACIQVLVLYHLWFNIHSGSF